ncbi:hypothetical protein B0A50_04938 [Salinomyces thailandicus]|uniref:Tudor domain-containing protein n=1 Tax=Salinomyces thailandicus TaxID=706561 RepID=A0A4U0TY03_9PEZI|nr:hypothetical protein B0A50_04938 [Salinomyces thailandica]
MGSNELSRLQAELAECEENINTCNDMLAFEPDDAGANETKAMMEELIKDLTAQIEAETAKQSAAAPPPPPLAASDDAFGSLPKFDMSQHPKFKDQSTDAPPPPPTEEPQQPAIFEVKNTVMAKYKEDRQWYQATIVSRTGSTADPVYTVTFKGYGNTETKRKHEIRPMNAESKKRKADGTLAVPAAPPPASPKAVAAGSGHVISAAPAVDTSLVQPRREPSKVSDGPTRMAPEPKKLKGNKALEKGKSSWNSWQKSGPKKPVSGAVKRKESMFKTPDNPNARVGFTGSGKAMTKDQARGKWKYGADDEED